MKNILEMNFTVDKDNMKILVERGFEAPIQKVWEAWTLSELLDQWWAPKPWQTKTKSMDFRKGGYWLYAMVGPDNTSQWCRADFQIVEPPHHFTGRDAFCDEDGNVNQDFPIAAWDVHFKEVGDLTMVNIELKYEKPEDLQKYIEMGFKEGFTAALGNLDELLSK